MFKQNIEIDEMIKQTIKIDESKCVGCGLCVTACQEGVIGLVDGKAKLLHKDHCDGLGNCLPGCPVGAISFANGEAEEHREDSDCLDVHEAQTGKLACGCPSTQSKAIERNDRIDSREPQPVSFSDFSAVAETQLMQWPVQIQLVAPNAPYLKNARLLIAADCAAYAYGNFHNEYMKNRITLIGCPKLDDTDYSDKLTEILKYNDIESLAIVRMEVPC